MRTIKTLSGLIALLFVMSLAGCQTTPKKAAYTTLSAIGVAVDNAMNGAADAKVAGKITPEQWARVASAHAKFIAAYSTACDIAGQDVTQLAPADLIAVEKEVLNTINTILAR